MKLSIGLSLLVLSLRQTVRGDIILLDDLSFGIASTIVRRHYRDPETYVKAFVRNGNSSTATIAQRDLLDDLLRSGDSGDWVMVSFEDLPASEWRPAYYGVFFALDYGSLCALLDEITYETHHFYGLYTIFIEQFADREVLDEVMRKLWSISVMNVVVVVEDSDRDEYVAYSYNPYREQRCGKAEPYEAGRYVNGSWTNLDDWFPNRLRNLNGCPLRVGTVNIKPCSIFYYEANRTTHRGIEVSQMVNLSKKLNFTIDYRVPEGNVKWGIMRSTNSTGLVGLIQRKEVDVGFGSMGIGAARVQYLRQGTPSRYGQIRMAIPPKRPYTSFEKLFQPFSLQTWLCVVLCHAFISALAWAMVGWGKVRVETQLSHTFYTMWVLLMGGSCGRLRLDSTRIFIVSFILNMLVVRTLYHAAMFEKLQASDSLASDLNTFDEINRAGKMYYMHRTITLYFNDNPLVGPRRILIIQNDTMDWEEILYSMSQHKANFVVALPLDCIKYYVKMNGKRGLVYLGKHTELTYNTAFYYPKTTPLQEPFSALILTFHSAGLVNYWAQEFEDNRFWSNARTDPEPASLQWDHISGAVYLCGAMHLLACAVFVAELGYALRDGHCAGFDPELTPAKDSSAIAAVLNEHYRAIDSVVHVRVRNGNCSSATLLQADLINDMTRLNSDWMIVTLGDLPPQQQRPAYYSVFFALDYDSLHALLVEITYETHQFYGFYTIFVEQLADREVLDEVMRKLWSISVMNVVVIVEDSDGDEYVAYSYNPYQEQHCGKAEPYEAGRYVNGSWTNLDDWFPDRLLNMHACTLSVGVIEMKPYSMSRLEGNRTVRFGLEVNMVDTVASRLNFTIRYVQPKDNVKWGILHPKNSTGLVGMLQRHEADLGFGSLGVSLSRHTYLKMSTPSYLTQMVMAIPPKRPYTSLEKLFQPFTIDAWLCIAFGYAAFGVVTLVLVRIAARGVLQEHLRHPLYMLWVLLLGGSGSRWRLNSTRLFFTGFLLNTLVMRTLYQAGMFQRLQSSASLASDLNTLSAINKAGLNYNMFRSTLQFYKDNPMVPASRIRLVQNDHQEWDELFEALAHDRLGGVMASPADYVAYYVKRRGKYGVVYLGKNTGFMFNLGIQYPKATPLQGAFDAWILRLHASGLVHNWLEQYRDNRYWTNAKEDPVPASLKWNQISGGFALCGVLLVLASLVFLGELLYYHGYRLCPGRMMRAKKSQTKPKKVV
uniref:Ionotropic glutamate receptor L-glutamate and glycine-binding domain-containing protein n=1 Tax=Anopheles farauti TaxID=69004 RepID=A0A182QST3_9DIPT